MKKTKRMKPVYHPVEFRKIEETFENGRHLGRKIQTKFAILYLTGARVSEIATLRKRDFSYSTDKLGRETLVVKIPTLKNRNERFRYIPLVNEKPYKNMVGEIENYLDHLDSYEKIFSTYHRRTIARHLEKFDLFETEADFPKGLNKLSGVEILEFDKSDPTRKLVRRKWFPHYLRHCRLTHLVQMHHADATRLMFWAGWTDTRLARIYIHLDWSNLAELIQSGQISQNY